MLTKVSIEFKQPTFFDRKETITTAADAGIVNQLFGWSENFYLDGDAVTQTATPGKVESLINKRVKLLADEAWVHRFRLQKVDPTGAARTYKYYKPGSAGEANDDPCNCLVYNCRSTNAHSNRREVILRGLPDKRLTNGEFTPNATFRGNLRAFFAELTNGAFGFRATDMSQDTRKLKQISGTTKVALLQLEGAEVNPFNGGARVQILRSLAAGHRFKGQKVTTVMASDGVSVTLFDWPHGDSKGGRIRRVVTPVWRGIELTQHEIDNPEVSNRDTGPPTDQPRGRQSAKYA